MHTSIIWMSRITKISALYFEMEEIDVLIVALIIRSRDSLKKLNTIFIKDDVS